MFVTFFSEKERGGKGRFELILRQVFQDVIDEVAEALIDEKDSRTRTDMVELVIVALLKVLFQSLFHILFLLSQLPSDQFYLEEISRQLLPALQDPKCK